MRATMLIPIPVMLLASCTPAAPPGPPRPTASTAIACSVSTGGPMFTAKFVLGSVRNPVDTLQVTFTSRPTSGQAEAALRACIESMRSAVRVDYETLVNAWVDDDGPLSLPDGSSSLAYDPKTGTVKTWNEREGVSPETAKRKAHTVETTENKMAVPPFTPFLTMHVLFEKAPPGSAAIEKILTTEVEAAARQRTPRVDVMAFALVGPAGDRNAQQQIRGASGTFLSVEFRAKTGEVRSQDKRLLTSIR
jgi:hypothetical protein